MDIIYSKGNNIRRQACWVATEKPFPFLIGKVLTDEPTDDEWSVILGEFPFLIGKVLTTKPEPTRPTTPKEFPFLIGKVLTIQYIIHVSMRPA